MESKFDLQKNVVELAYKQMWDDWKLKELQKESKLYFKSFQINKPKIKSNGRLKN